MSVNQGIGYDSIIASSDADVNRRIEATTAAFRALTKVLSRKYLDCKAKGQVYVALCLSILLYGSEVWCLQEDFFHHLRGFHHRCCRIMCCITMAHTFRHHISSADLFEQLGLSTFGTYYHRRLLRWAGHVSRMRAPRQLLTNWVAHKRPIGCPQMNWCRTLKKALLRNSLPGDVKE
jgi:hypothetical protein